MDHKTPFAALSAQVTQFPHLLTDQSSPRSELVPQSTMNQLSVDCFGRIELPEDEPVYGTYWTRYAVSLGVCANLVDAMKLAERRMLRRHVSLIDVALARAFAPERILIRDSLHRVALGGEVIGKTIEWCNPVTSDDEASSVRRAAANLRVESAIESGWDNYSTARGLDHRAELLEARLVDPIWRVEAANALQLRSHNNLD